MHFFIHMKTIVGNCFATLHQLSVDKSHSIRNDDDTQSRFKRALHKSFNVGLRYISGWDETIHEQEALSARKQFPTIEDDYRYTLVQYVKYLHRKRSSRVRMKVPPFQNFLFWLLRRIAATEEMTSMTYFSDFKFTDKDTFLREMLRQTLGQDCLAAARLRGGGDEDRRSHSSSRHGGEAASEAAASEAVPPQSSSSKAAAASAASRRTRTGGGIQPEDSISNVAPPSSVHPRYSSTLRLTPSLLKSHLDSCGSLSGGDAPGTVKTIPVRMELPDIPEGGEDEDPPVPMAALPPLQPPPAAPASVAASITAPANPAAPAALAVAAFPSTGTPASVAASYSAPAAVAAAASVAAAPQRAASCAAALLLPSGGSAVSSTASAAAQRSRAPTA